MKKMVGIKMMENGFYRAIEVQRQLFSLGFGGTWNRLVRDSRFRVDVEGRGGLCRGEDERWRGQVQGQLGL